MTETGATRGRRAAASLPAPGLDALITSVVLAAAVGFRFLGERHLRGPAVAGDLDLLVALEVVLIPLALAAMALAGRRPDWREIVRPRRLAWRGVTGATLGALLLTAPGAIPSMVPDGTNAAAVAALITADEMLRRGFLLNAIAAVLGGGRAADAAALVLLACGAVAGYAPGGASRAVAAGATDLVLGSAYLLSGRTLWAPVLARLAAELALRTG